MTGQCRLDADFRSLKIANLTDHDDIGILTQKSPQGCGKVEADLFMHLHLIDPGKVEFNRVFRRRNILCGFIEFREGRVKRNRFSTPGRPGDQNHPERLVNLPLEPLQRLLFITQLGHVELQIAFIKQPQNNLLAEQGRQTVDTIIHLNTAAHFDLDPTVLW